MACSSSAGSVPSSLLSLGVAASVWLETGASARPASSVPFDPLPVHSPSSRRSLSSGVFAWHLVLAAYVGTHSDSKWP
uniref:Putative secreted protein n=1 Tax=Ixodes ricinus TaxID=34613 RepID=A0A6B0U506_IXORI